MEFFDDLSENFNEIRNVSFGEKFGRSFKILTDGFKAFFKYPVLLIPVILHIVLISLIMGGIFLYLQPYADMNAIPPDIAIYVVLTMCLLICSAYTICAFIMLEFIQQIETGEKICILKALYEAFVKNLIKGLPLIIIWTIISFIGKILKGKRSKETFFGTCIRLSMYCILPAIAWEDYGSIGAIKRGIKVLKKTYTEIFFSIVQTSVIGFLLILPIPIVVWMIFTFSGNIQTCLIVIVLFIGYAVFVGALCEYVGQMFAASLFIWYKKWEREVRNARINNTSEPSLYDIPMPSLLDDVPDLVYKKH